MSAVIDTAPNYTRAVELWPEASTLRGYYDAIIQASEGDTHGLVEHVKGFIECICVTILSEFNVELPSTTPSSTELLVAALRPLGLQNSKGASKLDKVLSGFNKLSDAISEMRNESGPVAHGKDGFVDALCSDHGRVFFYTGDAIVGILLNALEGTEPDLLVTREPYDRFAHLGEKIDRTVSIKAKVEVDDTGHMLLVTVTVAGNEEESTTLRIEPSRLLYGLDRAAFIDVLNEAASVVLEPEEAPVEVEEAPVEVEEAPVEVEEAPVEVEEAPVEVEEPLPAFVAAEVPGHGEVDSLRIVEKLTLPPESAQVDPARIQYMANQIAAAINQNRVVDWSNRYAPQAELRNISRAILRKNGYPAEVREYMVEQLFEIAAEEFDMDIE